MNSLIRFSLAVLLFGRFVCTAQAEFSSLYIFGDGVSTTSTNHIPDNAPFYFGGRWSNGRVWVEALAQQLDMTNNYWYSNNPAIHLSYTSLSASSTNWSYSSNNWSYYGHYSTLLVSELTDFIAPPDASNALFVVWVNDADFVNDVTDFYPSTNIASWTNAINLSLTNHYVVITNLYAKGARTLLMPNAVDLGEVPEYAINYPSSFKKFVRQMVIHFNTAFSAVLSNAMVSCPGLKIYEPDFFSLLDNILTNPGSYGVTNALYNGQSVDAIEDPSLSDKSRNGPGANYIFWDYTDPTAKVSAIMAGLAKQLIEPVRVVKVTSVGGSNRLDLVNVPVGLNGNVLGSSNLAPADWTALTNFPGTNDTLSVFLPTSGPMQFYRLKFPYSWTWP